MSTSAERLLFLNCAYFNIGPELLDNLEDKETSKKLIDKCINKAYQDLKRKMPYRYSTDFLKTIDEDKKKEFRSKKKSFIDEIHSTIYSKITVNNDVIEITEVPSKIIEEVVLIGKKYCDIFKESEKFTVGLAQKWVNMTLKYLWILGVLDEKCEDELEVPIDAYILEAIAIEGIDVVGIKWSKWDDLTQYKSIQNALKAQAKENAYTRISWENEKWVDIAEKRNK